MTTVEASSENSALVIRSALMEEMVARMRTMGVEPAPEVLDWYAAYSAGTLSFAQLMAHIYARVDALSASLATLLAHEAAREDPY